MGPLVPASIKFNSPRGCQQPHSNNHNHHHHYAFIMVTIVAVTALVSSAIQCMAMADRMTSVISWTANNGHPAVASTSSIITTPQLLSIDNKNDSNDRKYLRTKTSSSLPLSSSKLSVSPNVTISISDNHNNNNYHPIKSILDEGKKVLLFELGPGSSHGLGSSMIWILFYQIYFEDISNGNRQLVLDQRKTTSYRTNTTHGAYTGLFTTSFPVLDTLAEPHNDATTIDYKWQSMNTSTNPTQHYAAIKDNNDLDVIKIRQEDTLEFIQARKIVTRKYNRNSLNEVMLFERLSSTLCNTIQLNNDIVNNQIHDMLSAANIPNFATSTIATASSSTGGNRTLVIDDGNNKQQDLITVAFHIRRGDKLKLESRAYRGYEYVNKLIKALENNKNNKNDDLDKKLSKIQHCFVATDNYNAVIELQTALTNANINCTLHTLTTPTTKTNRNTDGAISFLAEMKVLIDATYFVGSFNSNVGSLVALHRGCTRRKPENEIDEMDIYRKYQHYYNSYGVDSDEWGRSLYIY